MLITGIDFGNKFAGTTAICIGNIEGKVFEIKQSQPKKDSDKFLINEIIRNGSQNIFIDAPLSLPGVYLGYKGCSDYFFRKCDRETGAMSPMFLGGLTARAIQLKEKAGLESRRFFEVWPSKLASVIGIPEDIYRHDLKKAIEFITDNKINLNVYPENWHQFDSVLALISGIRYYNEDTLRFGDDKEGLIYV